MTEKRIHAIVHGRVQGVFFRDYTRQEAIRLGLRGWVRNLADGTVETVFEGEPEKVDKMLAWLQVGSPMAQVTRVDSREETPHGQESGFTIRYHG